MDMVPTDTGTLPVHRVAIEGAVPAFEVRVAGREVGPGEVGAHATAGAGALVATGRDINRLSQALGQSNDLLNVNLDVTRRNDAEAAVRAAVDRFGRIDALVNNAASFYATRASSRS